MLFSSVTFLFAFLPLLLAIYYVVPAKVRNTVLLAVSVIFYGWGEPIYLFLMLFTIFAAWFLGLFIDKFRGTKNSKLFMIISVCISIGLLVLFKYSDFFIENINNLFKSNITLLKLALPIGISFYTFQILSYTIDLYRGDVKVQRNPFDFAMYDIFFPQLIAGPIVRYATIENEISARKVTLEDFSAGVTRFLVGLSKKILIANVLGELCEIYKGIEVPTVLFTWLYIIAYAFHIYFDFSGYSDMAIGLGRMFGFRFLENFNYPYISKSVTEFWRRWHISLSTIFRDYVYIPLGGNRVSKPRWFFNIFVVWFLTGFWHGADWNFILWGLWYGVLLVLEKLVLGKFFAKLPAVFGWIWAMFATIIGWMFFDATSMSVALARIGNLFGAGGLPLTNASTAYYLTSYALVLVLAAIGSTPLPKKAVAYLKTKTWAQKAMVVIEPLFIAVMLILVCAYLIDGSFNPFIYFRF